MKTTFVLFGLALLLFFTSCDSADISFDSPFPKKNKKLTDILGNEIIVKRKTDTLYLNISSNKNLNLITYNTGDTLFYGTVAKYRGLYYFSERIKENYYFIYAVKISDSLIYGLNSEWSQMCSVEEEIKKGNNKKLLSYMNSDTTIIRLHPYKDEMKNVYSVIINNIIPDTIVIAPETQLKNNIAEHFDIEEMEIIQKLYPNPAIDLINIDFQRPGIYSYQISSLNGSIVSQGKLFEKTNKIDLNKIPAGIYMLTVTNIKENKKESLKFLKTQ